MPSRRSTKMSDTSLSVFEIRVNAVKPWTLPSSILPVLLGTLLAYKSGQPFDPFPFILCSFVIIGTHAAGNFVNSYYEAKNRRFTRPRERNTTVHETARSAVATYCIVIPSFALLLVSSAADIWQELALFLAGFIASVLFGKYLKNIALGELVVSAVYGPLCVMFTYAVQVGSSRRELSGSLVALYSLPLALCTECMLHSQNIRDMKVDKERGAHTLALLLGNSFCPWHSSSLSTRPSFSDFSTCFTDLQVFLLPSAIPSSSDVVPSTVRGRGSSLTSENRCCRACLWVAISFKLFICFLIKS
ncbi:hypothetical protein QZH41_011282 [Actinostola sp. cb2023]|nr:hypothetical protein QZH41_011282 [Actinostola sp. cb2023]